MKFEILTDKLLDDYTKAVFESPLDKIDKSKKLEMPVDYFQFYKSVSSVYSSKIEGEDIDFDSYFKHKFLKHCCPVNRNIYNFLFLTLS